MRARGCFRLLSQASPLCLQRSKAARGQSKRLAQLPSRSRRRRSRRTLSLPVALWSLPACWCAISTTTPSASCACACLAIKTSRSIETQLLQPGTFRCRAMVMAMRPSRRDRSHPGALLLHAREGQGSDLRQRLAHRSGAAARAAATLVPAAPAVAPALALALAPEPVLGVNVGGSINAKRNQK